MSETIKTQSIYLWYRVKQRKKKGNNFVKAFTTRVECRSLGLVTKMSLLLDCAMSTSLFWIGEDKRYLKIQLIEPLIRHVACFRMILHRTTVSEVVVSEYYLWNFQILNSAFFKT